MRQPTLKQVTDALKRLDYPFFKGDYNLNLIGVRSADLSPDTFNDQLLLVYQVGQKTHLHHFEQTTDPGVYYRKKPINVDGTAILKPGHYRGCWRIGNHQGKYPALVQRGPMTVYRDADADSALDMDDDNAQTGLFGINLHRALDNHYSLNVGRWSAGCQVLANSLDFDLVMAFAKKSAAIYGPSFSYTLLTEDQL